MGRRGSWGRGGGGDVVYHLTVATPCEMCVNGLMTLCRYDGFSGGGVVAGERVERGKNRRLRGGNY